MPAFASHVRWSGWGRPASRQRRQPRSPRRFVMPLLGQEARFAPMFKMIVKRLVGALPNVIGVVVVTFLLTRALPGDPAAYFAGPAATQEAIEQIRVQLGLDKSIVHQFALYLKDLARGDLGNSLSTGQPVVTELASRLPASLE